MNKSLVSVCMPAYNAERYISEAISSILNQSHQNIELIIVNDGSTDNTLSVIKSFSDSRIKYFSTANLGQCTAANKAFELSSGNFIKFFDADDVLSPNLLEAQLAVLDDNETEISSTKWGRFRNNDLQTFKLNKEDCWKDMQPVDWLVSSWQKGEPMMQCGLWLIPRKILYKSGLWDEKLTLINDFDFFTRVILASKKIRFAEKGTLYYRSGISNSLSSRTTEKAVKSAILSSSMATKHLLNRENSERTRRVAANCLINLVYQYGIQYPKIIEPVEQQVKVLNAHNVSFKGGLIIRFISILFGWKIAARLRLIKNA